MPAVGCPGLAATHPFFLYERRYKTDFQEIHAAGVLLSAPYAGSRVQVRLAFLTLQTGDFLARDRTGFLENPDSAVHVEVQSPAYAVAGAPDSLTVKGGKVRVGLAANGAISSTAR